MKIPGRSALLVSLTLTLGAAGCADDAEHPSEPPVEERPTPPGLVLVIADGMGRAHTEAARHALGELILESLPVHGTVLTGSASDSITDSGAAATALATGFPTFNGAIGVDEDSVPRPTILEMAAELGMATGLVATSSVTHATPAAFAAHVSSRSRQMEIARQMSESGVDVLLGGGRQFFSSATRPDGVDLTSAWSDRGCEVLEQELDPSADADCFLGLFADDAMPEVASRAPTLAEMTGMAVERLARDPEGFFLMVEGSQIDWASHDNDGPRMVAEVGDLDQAVEVLLEAVEGRARTLVVVTADHETGGLTVGQGAGGQLELEWATTKHTATPVAFHAQGITDEPLPDTLSNHALGRALMAWLVGETGG